jgi:hypothetical protein
VRHEIVDGGKVCDDPSSGNSLPRAARWTLRHARHARVAVIAHGLLEAGALGACQLACGIDGIREGTNAL